MVVAAPSALLALLPGLLGPCVATTTTSFEGQYFSGVASSDDGLEQLQLLDIARRSLGEPAQEMAADTEIQTMPMLYSGGEDGLLEGPTWGAYWTQNSYGTSMTTVPFLGDVALHGLRESQNWWLDNMADGTTSNYHHGSDPTFSAPDGTMCDNGEPNGCNFKQGDGDVPIHDWTLEETLSGVVMQAELLLINRNISAIAWNLPRFVRTFNLIEARRDFAVQGLLFLSGPSSNLLAPSFGGWTLDNGRHAWSYMTGTSVTYGAALLRAIECAKMLPPSTTLPLGVAGQWNVTKLVSLLEGRLALVRKGLMMLLAPSGDFFVRSLDPNGTMHGVPGQSRHGYFEASPNHDAVALGVVNASLGARIVAKIKSLGALLRPNVFILPNTDAHGKPSVSGSGAVGYDDMACGDGHTCGGIFNFGTWVNGGVWTTTEGRWLMAAALQGDLAPAFASVAQMQKLFGATWRMDNPIVNFGLAPYQPDEEINLTVDNFASAGGLLRGLFGYIYDAISLTLKPLVPDTVTALSQNFGARWGPYSLRLSTAGVRSSGIASVSLNGQQLKASSFNSSAITLMFAEMPAATAESLNALSSEISTASTHVTIHITFKHQQQRPKQQLKQQQQQQREVTERGAAPPPPATAVAALAGWWHASDLTGATGSNISHWPNRVSGAPAAEHPGTNSACTTRVSGRYGMPTVAATTTTGAKAAGALFSEPGAFLCAAVPERGDKSYVAAFTAAPTGAPSSWGCLLCGKSGGWDGIAVGPTAGGGVKVELDYSGSNDDTHHAGIDVRNRTAVAVAIFNSSASTSYVDGCFESSAGPHLDNAEATIIGARGDPQFEYGRHFLGTIHELRIYNRSLTAAEVAAVSAEMAQQWGVHAADSNCSARPTPEHECLGSAPTAGLMPNTTVEQLQKFVASTAKPPLLKTHPAALARLSLSYWHGYKQRCAGLKNGTVAKLRSFGAEEASLKQMVTTALSAATGLSNFMTHTVNRSSEPIAKPLLEAWMAAM